MGGTRKGTEEVEPLTTLRDKVGRVPDLRKIPAQDDSQAKGISFDDLGASAVDIVPSERNDSHRTDFWKRRRKSCSAVLWRYAHSRHSGRPRPISWAFQTLQYHSVQTSRKATSGCYAQKRVGFGSRGGTCQIANMSQWCSRLSDSGLIPLFLRRRGKNFCVRRFW